ncbi:MAG: hypothetical protein H6818_20580 [Phycisphaerales bacterium]|nr:hypothetical protein [Phycisphaerales bacterium]
MGRFRTVRFRIRRGFTFVELLIAASMTAMTLAAGATMISAVTNAAMETKDVRNSKKSGQMTADRLSAMIRQARAVGQVTSTSILLWNGDTNGDEIINLNETCLLYYDGATDCLKRWQTFGASESDVGPVVPQASFENAALWSAQATAVSPKQSVFAENIARFAMSGFPSNTETRIVNFAFAIDSESTPLVFRESASLRASADYIFNADTHEDPETSGEPSRRTEFSRWTGWADVDGEAVTYPN